MRLISRETVKTRGRSEYAGVHCRCRICRIEWTPDPRDDRPVCPRHGSRNMVETKAGEVEITDALYLLEFRKGD